MAEEEQQYESSGYNAATAATFGLDEAILTVLPSDPFEQLDIARKITSIALATRVTKLESDISALRRNITQKDAQIADLSAHAASLDASVADLSRALARAEEEKEALVNDNASLSDTVKKLNKDVSKLEVFKKALVQSLREEDDSQGGGPKLPKNLIQQSTESPTGDDDATTTPPPLKPSSTQSQVSETGSSVTEDSGYNDTDASKHSVQHNLRIPSMSTTPRLTPPGSPPRISAAFSPRRLSKPTSPRRHSIAIPSGAHGRSYSSMPTNTMTSPFDTGAQTARARVDGKEFFRQVRSRLSYEQFGSFLANVKELNSHKQTREETLLKAEEIFGPDNKDLYIIFEGLITRNLH